MTAIGGEVYKHLGKRLLPAEPRELTRGDIDGLWHIFVAIGTIWENIIHHSAGLKSSWLAFVREKTKIQPSYVCEYVNALEVVEELVEMKAFEKPFLDNGIPLTGNGTPIKLDTPLARATHFVVDEFIRVQIIAGGFRDFIRPIKETPDILPQNIVNYNGFIAGSRYAHVKPVRSYQEPSYEEPSE